METTETGVIPVRNDIEIAQLMVLKQHVRLESVGMKHSSGKSMRKHACKVLGLSANTGVDTVLGVLNREINRQLNARFEAQLPDTGARKLT